MKRVSIVFTLPSLTNRVLELTDVNFIELVRSLSLSWAKGVSEIVYVPVEDDANYRTGEPSRFYLRSDLIAYIKVIDVLPSAGTEQNDN